LICYQPNVPNGTSKKAKTYLEILKAISLSATFSFITGWVNLSIFIAFNLLFKNVSV